MHMNSKSFSPFLSIINKEAKTNSNNKGIYIYAIYIHEEERRKVNSPCMHALHEKEMTKP